MDMPFSPDQFLDVIRYAFINSGITQHEFARRVNYSPGYISKLLGGTVTLPPDRWPLFLSALNSASMLMQRDNTDSLVELGDLYTTPIPPDEIAIILAHVLQAALLTNTNSTLALMVVRTTVHLSRLISPLIATTAVSLDARLYRIFAHTLFERGAFDQEVVKTFLPRAHAALRPHIEHKWTTEKRLALSRQIVWHLRLIYAALAESYGLEISYNDGLATLSAPPS